jgi:methyl-accepting chemotaxis protein
LQQLQVGKEEMEKQNALIAEKAAETESILSGVNESMATIEFSPEGIVLNANANFMKTMKCSLADIKGKHHRNFVPAEILNSEEYKHFWSDLAAGRAKKGMFKRINTAGETVWLNAIYNPMFDAQGNVTKVIKFATDVTEQKTKEAETEAQMNIINSVAIVSKTDVKGNIIEVNEEFLKWSKYSREEVIGKNHRILRHEDMPAAAFEDLWKTISTGKVWRGEVKNKAKDGSFYWVDAIIAPVLDEFGKPKEYIAQRFVINEQKRKEQEMQSMLEETRAQEEEIRQNLEEVQAQQEEMARAAQILAKEEAAKKSILEGIDASMATIEFTPDGIILHANENFLKVMRCALEDIVGKHHSELVPKEEITKEEYEKFWKHLNNGLNKQGVFKRVSPSGEIVWLNAVYNPIKNGNGEVDKIIKIATDLTEQKKQEAEIEAQNNIINSVAIVSKTDLQGNIIYANDECCKWSGYSREELMGKNHRILRHPDMPAEAFEDMWKTISSGKTWRGEVKNKAKNGSVYWVDAIIAPVFDENGKPKEYIAQRFVINDKKEKEERLKQLEAQLSKN